MQRISFRLAFGDSQAEAFSDALLAAGALSAWIEDADAGTPEESARFAEPGVAAPGEAWARNRVTVLAADAADIAQLVAAAALEAGLAAPAYDVEPVPEQDWVREVQSQFAPLQVGRRLWVVPSWHQPPAAADAVVLRIDPGRAFGTGGHPSTRLVLAWLESVLGAHGGEAVRVLDYGCGSGILGIAAALLGADDVTAVDVDPQALGTASDNARINRVAIQVCAPDSLQYGEYEVVVANILSQPLIVLAPMLVHKVRLGGCLALSGILEAHAEEVIAAYAPEVRLRVAAADEGWVLLEGIRSGIRSGIRPA